jgi:hypothetical protein
VLTGSIDNTVRLWDAAAGNEIRAFKGHENIVTSVVFSPDGAQVLTGAWDNIARLWDAATGKAIRAEHSGSIGSPSAAGEKTHAGPRARRLARANRPGQATEAEAVNKKPAPGRVPLHDSRRGLFLCCGTAINCRGSGFAVAAHQPMSYLLVGKSPFVIAMRIGGWAGRGFLERWARQWERECAAAYGSGNAGEKTWLILVLAMRISQRPSA